MNQIELTSNYLALLFCLISRETVKSSYQFLTNYIHACFLKMLLWKKTLRFTLKIWSYLAHWQWAFKATKHEFYKTSFHLIAKLLCLISPPYQHSASVYRYKRNDSALEKFTNAHNIQLKNYVYSRKISEHCLHLSKPFVSSPKLQNHNLELFSTNVLLKRQFYILLY